MKRETEQFKFEIKEKKPLHRGFYNMDQLLISHQKFNGEFQNIQRELMDRYDAVCVLLVDLANNKTVFIEQFRVGAMGKTNPWLIELVAGLIDKDEKPEEVARREAIEEAGVSIGRMEFIAKYFPSPGGTNEQIYLYVGEVDSSTAAGIHGLEHEGEDIRVEVISIDEAFQWLENGTINNAASIIALQWLKINQDRLTMNWA